MADNRQIAQEVLAAVGGRDNVTFATHCMTRLRLNLNDQSLASDDAVKAIDGVKGVFLQGGQYQVVIGQNVPQVYQEFVPMAGIETQAAIDENLDADAPKEPLTLKGVGNAILDYVSGSVSPVVPGMVGAGLFKTLQAVFGPTMLGILPAESGFYQICDIVFNALMYFLPFFVAMNASKKLKTTPAVSMLLAAILLQPTFVELVESGASLDFLGIPVYMGSYAQTVLPVLFVVWAQSYVEGFFKKHIPELLSTVFVPFCTLLVMVPLELCALAPIGSVVGGAIGSALVALGNAGGIVSILGLGALEGAMPFIVVTGMHNAVAGLILPAFFENGYDNFFIVANLLCNFGVWGCALAAFLRFKKEGPKGEALGTFISGVVGGVTEPALFGICLNFPRTLVCVAVGNAISGILAGVLGVRFYTLGASSILCLLGFISADAPGNVISAAICGVVAFVACTALTYFFGFTEKELED